jgi:hypothetical protein
MRHSRLSPSAATLPTSTCSSLSLKNEFLAERHCQCPNDVNVRGSEWPCLVAPKMNSAPMQRLAVGGTFWKSCARIGIQAHLQLSQSLALQFIATREIRTRWPVFLTERSTPADAQSVDNGSTKAGRIPPPEASGPMPAEPGGSGGP